VCEEPGDDELMIRGAEGDVYAFELLVGRWERRVFSFLDYMLGSREEAQDVTQEAFIRMCQSAGKYRPSGQFRSWLFRIAGNLARSRLRRRKIIGWVRFDPAAHDLPDRGDRPDQPIEREEARAAVRRAVGKLPARQRQAIVLRQYQGMAYCEIADAMRTTVSAVETLLYRATVSLRRDLAQSGGGK
jgi:RNA polymerase sigma-70 factor (ECF subfamily)